MAHRVGVGRASRIPQGRYDPPPAAAGIPDGLTVQFQGEDGRQALFDVSRCDAPGWHEALAAALSARIGPAGPCRTLASARATWHAMVIFLSFVGQHTKVTAPEQLQVDDVRAFLEWRRSTLQEADVMSHFRGLGSLLRTSPVRERIPAEAMRELTRPRVTPVRAGKRAYSPYELKVLTRTVRRDVAHIRDRLLDGEKGLAARPSSTDPEDVVNAWKALESLAITGVVPDRAGPVTIQSARTAEARQLFLTWPDMTAMMALLVIVSGRNVETVKELPAEHRILDGRAVEVRLTKRRRGRRRWYETVTWEIGPPSRQLFTPGGVYLLVHQLCARGRSFSRSETIWSLWRNHQFSEVASTDEHVNPFANGLHKHSHYLRNWRPHGVIDPRTGGPLRTEEGALVRMDFQRLRKGLEVRRVRALGGHLPSAARSNTAQTLFSSYLRGDPSTREWAQEVVGQAIVDAESVTSSGPRVLLEGTDEVNEQTPWAECTDVNNHPATGQHCRSSFLDCFTCTNCVITPEHLPAIVGLRDALAHRRQHLTEYDWTEQYAAVWASIQQDILPRFTPTEVSAAWHHAPADSLLDLVEPNWERA